MTHYDAILFDLDNTLYDYDAYWAERLEWSLEVLYELYPENDIRTLVQRAIANHIYARDLPAFLQRCGVDDLDMCVRAQERYRINFFERLSLPTDTRHVLHVLRKQVRLGLVTNGPSYTQRPKIAQFELESLMDVVVISEEVGIAKPDPAIFHLALQHLGVSADQAVYVGDSLENDMMGAHAAGLGFVWMNPQQRPLPPGTPHPLAIVTKLPELLRLLT